MFPDKKDQLLTVAHVVGVFQSTSLTMNAETASNYPASTICYHLQL